MTLLIASFLAGMLTVAAPCILPLLPVIVGGAVALPGDVQKNKWRRHAPYGAWRRPLIITSSLAVSVIVFSLLLKATTALLGVPAMVWQSVSAVIVVLLGLSFLIPSFWEKVALKTGLATGPNRFLASSSQKQGVARDVLIGASLGPIFSSCSPTYALIVASILPATFIDGFIYLVAYAAGLSLMLLLIALLGQAFVLRLGWLANPAGAFRKIVGVLFIVVGISVLFGLDKKAQTFILDRGWYDPISGLEEKLR